MADYQVGNLQIVFNAVDETSKAFDNLAKNLNAVKKAISNIGNLGESDLRKFGDSLDKIREKFSPLLNDINSASAGLVAFNETTKQLGINKVSQVAQAFNEIAQTQEETSNATQDLNHNIEESVTLLTQTQNITPVSEDKISKTERFTQAMRELWGELNRTNTATKKGTNSFSKFFSSIKRIALYRLIRTVLKQITQSFGETVKAFAEVDDGVNSTMSNISSSLSVIKLSFGSIILPLLQMVSPIINQISVAFANMANIVLQATSTTGTYTKINANYWEDYRKQLEKTKGSLLDFDKFRALNTNQTGSLSDALIPNQAVDESDERVKKLRETFAKLGYVFSEVFDILKRVGEPAFDVFITLLDTAITILTPLISGLADFVRELDNAGLLKPVIWGITAALLAMGAVKVVTGISNVISAISNLSLTSLGLYATIGILAGAIAYFVSSLGDMGTAAKVLIPIISGLMAVVAGYAVAKAAAAAGIAAPVQAGVTAAALVAAIGMVAGTAIAKSIGSSTGTTSGGGGSFRGRGTTSSFSAMPAGSEMNYSLSSAQQGGSNLSIKQDVYDALVQYGNQNRGTGDSGAININIDGQRVFEATRRVANKKGLDFKKV